MYIVCIVISVKFPLTISNTTSLCRPNSTLLLPSFYLSTHQHDNINATVREIGDGYEGVRSGAHWALATSFFCFALDFTGLLCGFTLFRPSVNFGQVCFHFVGGVFTSWFVGESLSSWFAG